METAATSQTMRELGIVQEGDSVLTSPTRLFDLPAEADEARRVAAQLERVAMRVARVHVFAKGLGIAAPQIGIDRAASLLRGPDGEPLTLLNPKVIDRSAETTERYEGCLSFFDVRGLVSRPITITVSRQDISGEFHVSTFHDGMARLVAHQIDHLNGILYRFRMPPGAECIPVSEYNGTGRRW